MSQRISEGELETIKSVLVALNCRLWGDEDIEPELKRAVSLIRQAQTCLVDAQIKVQKRRPGNGEL